MAGSLLGVPTLMFLRRESSILLQAYICLSILAGCAQPEVSVFTVRVGHSPLFIPRQPWGCEVYHTALSPAWLLWSILLLPKLLEQCIASLISWYVSLFDLVYYFALLNPQVVLYRFSASLLEAVKEHHGTLIPCVSLWLLLRHLKLFFLILVQPFPLPPKRFLVICCVSRFALVCIGQLIALA